jgi:putative ABC transport system permease protein
MFAYYLDLALRSLRRSRALTVLMVLALALGIGACMTTFTVYHVLSGDPIPSKSERLFDVELDAASKTRWQPGDEPTFQLTRYDAETLLRAGRAKRQVMMSGGSVPVQPAQADLKPFYAPARFTSADFFAMFEAPFLHGGGWSAADDGANGRIVVISKSLNEKVFGGANSVGREITIRSRPMRVAGVLDDWRPVPHYYDLTTGAFAKSEDVFLPFSTAAELKFGGSGSMDCWDSPRGGASPRDLNAPCSWVQYWVELASAAEAPAFRDYLVRYSEEQLRAGRFERPPNVRLRNVTDWLIHREVLPGDVGLQVWLAFGFLLVCLVNTVGLLLAKCLRRSADIGVRRALGATKRAIFAQFVVEAGLLGAMGGLLGLALSALGLWLVRQSPAPYAAVAQMDWQMLGATLLLALFASLLAGVLPAWHAARIAPARHLKTL